MRLSKAWRAAGAAGIGVFLGASGAQGSAILQPATVTNSDVAVHPIGNTITQAGLADTYISGLSNFDVYTSETPFVGTAADGWELESPHLERVTFDLGGWYDIDGFAIWQAEVGTGVEIYDFYVDDDDDFGNGFGRIAPVGTTFTAEDTTDHATVLRFTAQRGVRYVHMRVLNSYGDDVVRIGEFAFREVDAIECETAPLWVEASDRENDDVRISDFAPVLTGTEGREMASLVSFENDVVIDCVRFWGVYPVTNMPAADSFTVRFYEDAGGGPEMIASQNVTFDQLSRVRSGFVAGNDDEDEFEYTATLSPKLVLEGGRDIWGAVMNDTPDTEFPWARTASLPGSGAVVTRATTDGESEEQWGLVSGSEGMSLELYGQALGGSSCPADFGGDGVVNSSDLAVLLAAWGVCP